MMKININIDDIGNIYVHDVCIYIMIDWLIIICNDKIRDCVRIYTQYAKYENFFRRRDAFTKVSPGKFLYTVNFTL